MSRSAAGGWAIAALLVGVIGISFASPLAKLAVQGSDVGWIGAAFWRTTLALPILWTVLLLTRSPARPAQREPRLAWWPLLIPGALFAGDLLTWHLSFAWTTAASATLLANLAVVLVGLAGWWWLRERLDCRYVIGAVLAVGGVFWLVTAATGPADHPLRLRGDLLAMLTAVFYAGYILSIKVLRSDHTAIMLMCIGTSASACILFLAVVASDEHLVPNSIEAWGWLALLAIVPHCLGQGLIVWSLSTLPASMAAVTLLLQPVATSVWGWLMLGEALGPSQITAGLVVIAGIVLARLGSMRAP
ncbi:MAG: DMT family transporter [Phycisphaerales bacterium]|jgi:drug/metabolite transporter (DMT)-like permease|nr:DMT family transporter [Phycisphaerales bacterium]